MPLLETITVTCPYCGEPFETQIDTSAGDQEYVEDCAVCCQPIRFLLRVDAEGQVQGLEVHRENE